MVTFLFSISRNQFLIMFIMKLDYLTLSGLYLYHESWEI